MRRKDNELAMLGYELDGVLAEFREALTAAPDAVCIDTITRVRIRLAELASGVRVDAPMTKEWCERMANAESAAGDLDQTVIAPAHCYDADAQRWHWVREHWDELGGLHFPVSGGHYLTRKNDPDKLTAYVDEQIAAGGVRVGDKTCEHCSQPAPGCDWKLALDCAHFGNRPPGVALPVKDQGNG